MKPEAKSRGGLVNAFLTQPDRGGFNTEKFLNAIVEDGGTRDIGGFTLVCGRVGQPLAVISNRTSETKNIHWILKEESETIGLSNAAISDRTWTKVSRAESLLDEIIKQNVAAGASQDDLIKELLAVLSDETLPKVNGMDWQSQVKELRNSIFIPPLGGEVTKHESAQDLAAAKATDPVTVQEPKAATSDSSGSSEVYGTQKQTIVLVSHTGHVTFLERTLFDEGGNASDNTTRDKCLEFDVQD